MQPSDYVLNVRRSLTGMRRDAMTQRAACLLELGSLASAIDVLQTLHEERSDDERVVVLLATAFQRMGADGRALRLITNALAQWQQVHGMLPPSLLHQRDLMVNGTASGQRAREDAI
jgi:hypothetical protein